MITPPLTRVNVRDLCFFGHHGVMEEEKRLGQRFFVSLEIAADLRAAIEGDAYEQAVCYAKLSEIASEIVTGPPLNLIETVAGRIAQRILERCALVQEVTVEVRKPSAPVPHVLQESSATVTQVRHHTVGFSLGANLGEREAVLMGAVNALSRCEGIAIEQVSDFYDSAPWGVEDQPPFVNIAAIGQTVLQPYTLLERCKQIESDLGRVPGRRWGARAVDIDILFYGDRSYDSAVLTLPHRHLWERAFVLEPLAELDPERKISGRRVKDALAQLPRTLGDVTRRQS
ncbi:MULTISPECIES: 2-amino-4-hydroxy-6-hydroxymethyldihydropteridine diphosphokinase [unclassified Saccharibacter]|uniref:2-amino-4-hydroxy-6- hydroxymethyldihydropteridine diphosphokinase n=1 Tax=unclassified Saccharibacter TaxID=2648722 RepID=UPI0013263566|nr:2-amino-4-hydroxy-6-hydroxymethyldihydropteridine diphosphokinase [Saccharibacter sp. EH611]MXV58609.1 2-amino-4-hydroxy-6-hydroxymethyldihydropteridine diphosphokinase [Saccharibacter sp. EH70]MXV66115.1 2-amino-4-hydroxy-6-hydroxymethyldihydropteridine diphosphokinase [Saccharibacter sp. EH60]